MVCGVSCTLGLGMSSWSGEELVAHAQPMSIIMHSSLQKERSSLMEACSNGHAEVVEKLLNTAEKEGTVEELVCRLDIVSSTSQAQ